MKRCLIAICLLVFLLLPGCGNTDTGAKPELQKPDKIRLAYSTSLTSELMIVAKQMGWFEEEFQKDGIAIEYNKFMNGPPIIEAFNGGRLDAGQVGDQPAIQAKANHIDIKVVGIFCKGVFTSEGKYTAVVVPNGSDITSIPDLRGKKVGVPVGTNYHKAFLYFLKYHGLTVNDIKLVNMDNANIKTAIASKSIDAGVIGEPYVSTIEYEGTGRKIEDHTDIKPVYNAIIVSSEFARQYPDVVKRILKVYDRTLRWVAENPQKANELVAKDTGVKPEIVEKAILSNQYDLRLTDEAVQSFQETERFLRENNIIKKDVSIKDLLDASYLEAVGLQKR